MERKISVGVSNRHVHLTKEVYDLLFDEELTKKNDLNQIGEFASNQVVTIKGKKGSIENVRVLGPLRNYNQVEISRTDAYKLGINPPVRRSGDLLDSEDVILETEKGSILLKNSCIIADRHVHINFDMAREMGLKDNQVVKILVSGDKACILYAHVKISDNGYYELHIDFDDANACGIKNNDELTLIY